MKDSAYYETLISKTNLEIKKLQRKIERYNALKTIVSFEDYNRYFKSRYFVKDDDTSYRVYDRRSKKYLYTINTLVFGYMMSAYNVSRFLCTTYYNSKKVDNVIIEHYRSILEKYMPQLYKQGETNGTILD